MLDDIVKDALTFDDLLALTGGIQYITAGCRYDHFIDKKDHIEYSHRFRSHGHSD